MANVYYPIPGQASTPSQTPGEISATAEYDLGTKLEARDGRLWRYAKAGAVQLSPGLMTQAPAIAAELINEVQTGYTTNIGDASITVLVTTSSGLTPADLAGGYLVVRDGAGEAHYYKISTAVWLTSDTVLTITLDEPIIVATAATSEVTLVPNRYNGAIVAPTTLTANCIGVPNLTVTANNYFWAQRRGPCAMVVDTGDTLVVGENAGYPATIAVAGAVGVPAVTDDVWGRVITVGAAGETALVELKME